MLTLLALLVACVPTDADSDGIPNQEDTDYVPPVEEDDDEDESNPDDPDDTEDAPTDCEDEGFANTATNWPTPDLGATALAGLANYWDCSGYEGGDAALYATSDLDADGRADLVVTYRCAEGAVGTSRWDVYKNEGDRFASTPVSWSLPDGFDDGELERFYGYDCADGALYTVMDIDGDGALDLVVTSRCDSSDVGTTRWDVYKNEGDGFSATKTSWALPSGFEGDAFMRASEWQCGAGQGNMHSTMDLTGDGRPDLVVTYRCESGPVGQDRWEVYENTGSGFKSTPKSWSLPSDYGDENPFYQTAVNDCTWPQEVMFSTVALDGDERPDLVVSYRCTSGDVGTEHWLVHENTGSGFDDEAKEWSLPSGYVDDAFAMLANGYCGDDAPMFSVMDMQGGPALDLVVSWDCTGEDDAVGTDHWNIYEGESSGFAEQATKWSLPTSYPEGSFAGIARSDCEEDGSPWYSTMDLDDDGTKDLIVSYTCDAGAVGTTRWLLHAGECAP